jgi:lipopolysaccharide export system permease protein
LDRYLLRQIVSTGLLILGVGFMVVMLERLLAVLRLVSSVSNVNNVLTYLGQMLVMLTPHYLGLILPAAFFLGTLLTLNRMSRDSELAVMFAAGAGLPRVLAPIMSLAVILMVISTIILGYLTPHARYTYRSFKHLVTHASLTASIRESTFMHAEDLTFFLEEKISDDSRVELHKVFVYKDDGDGEAVVTTANRGLLAQLPDGGGAALVLVDGERSETTAGGGDGKTTSFSELQWPIYVSGNETYGPRGRDRRELTLTELWAGRSRPMAKPSPAKMNSELQLRLVVIASIPFLPLLAAPLALSGGRTSRGHGIALGLLILIAYHKLLASGDSVASRDMVSPWIGLWLPFVVFSLGSAFFCFQSAYRVPRRMWLQSAVGLLESMLAGMSRAFARGR